MIFDELKQHGCKKVIHCNDYEEKQQFFAACRRNNILVFLSPYAINDCYHFKVCRTFRFELSAKPENQVKFYGYDVIEWKEIAGTV